MIWIQACSSKVKKQCVIRGNLTNGEFSFFLFAMTDSTALMGKVMKVLFGTVVDRSSRLKILYSYLSLVVAGRRLELLIEFIIFHCSLAVT